MRTNQIHQNRLGPKTVSTVFIEPFGYYETAILERNVPVRIVESFIADADEASELHRATVESLTE